MVFMVFTQGRGFVIGALFGLLRCHLGETTWFTMPRTPLLWQRGFFLVNCLALRRLLTSVRSGVVYTFRCAAQLFMTANSYDPSSAPEDSPVLPRPAWSRFASISFAFAAVPAALLPLCYFVVCGRGVWLFATGGSLIPQPFGIQVLGWIGVYGTLFQLPFYMLWALLSRQVTWKHRLSWFGLLFLLNMLAIPVFLYAKYSGTAATMLSRPRS